MNNLLFGGMLQLIKRMLVTDLCTGEAGGVFSGLATGRTEQMNQGAAAFVSLHGRRRW
jgi:hypothetical protein